MLTLVPTPPTLIAVKIATALALTGLALGAIANNAVQETLRGISEGADLI